MTKPEPLTLLALRRLLPHITPRCGGVVVLKGKSMKNPCLAIVLIPGCDPNYAASYHWCKNDVHPEGSPHVCYCGIWWLSDDLVEPTDEMLKWRTGSEPELKAVSRRMLG